MIFVTMSYKVTYVLSCLFIILDCIFASIDAIVELNHDLSPDSKAWPTPGYQPFQHTPLYEGFTKEGYWYTSYKFCAAEHIGTHIDAPSHFHQHGWTVDKIPLERLFAPAVVIDIRRKVKTNMVYELTAGDVVEWVEEHGLFPNNSIVLVLTGWSARYDDKVSYFGHPTDPSKFAFPGASVSAVQTLLGYKASSGIHMVGIGIDTPSIDYGPSRVFRAHQELSSQNVYILENLNNLDKLPPTGTELIVMPLKIKNGSGSPSRVIAMKKGSLCLANGGSLLTSYDGPFIAVVVVLYLISV